MLNPFCEKGRIPSLDGWRAIAIMLVLGDHMVFATGFPYEGWGWRNKIFSGELGVRIFFVLSGFLISLLLLRESDKTGQVSLKDFYARRIFRIFPVYFAYLAVLAILVLVKMYTDSLSSWIGCLTFSRNIIGQGKSATVHFWSLAVEEQFYLLWPLTFGLLCLWRRNAIYLGVLAIPILLCPIIRAFFVSSDLGATWLDRVLGPRSILVYADSLAVGCMGAWIAWRNPTSGAWCRSYTILLMVSLAVIIAGRVLQVSAGPQWNKALDALVPSFQAWAILACLWLSASPDSPGYRLLNSPPMVALGLLSYSIYVWHFFHQPFHGRGIRVLAYSLLVGMDFPCFISVGVILLFSRNADGEMAKDIQVRN